MSVANLTGDLKARPLRALAIGLIAGALPVLLLFAVRDGDLGESLVLSGTFAAALAIVAGLLGGPVAGAAAGATSGVVFITIATEARPGSVVAMGLWMLLGVGSGITADRARVARREADQAKERATRMATVSAALSAAPDVRSVVLIGCSGACMDTAVRRAEIGLLAEDAPLVTRWGWEDEGESLVDLEPRTFADEGIGLEAMRRMHHVVLAPSGSVEDSVWLAIPFGQRERPRGYVAAQSDQPFAAHEIEEMEALAAQVGEALARAQSFEREQRVRARNEGLHEFARRLSAARSREAVSDAILEVCVAATDPAGGLLTAFVDDTQETLARFGQTGSLELTTGAPTSERSPLGWALQHDTPVFLRSPEEGQERFPETEDLAEGAIVYLPLFTGGEGGAFVTLSFEGSQEFPSDQRDLLISTTNQGALALARADAGRREHLAYLEAETLSARLTRLRDLAISLSTAVTTEDAVQAALSSIAQVVGAARATIVLPVRGKAGYLCYLDEGSVVSVDRDARTAGVQVMLRRRGIRQSAPIAEGFPDEAIVLAGRRPPSPVDEDSDANVLPFPGLIAVPLLAGGPDPLGAVSLYFDQEDVFTDIRADLLDAMAAQVALALARTQRFDAEHEVARVLQESLLPPLVEVEGLSLAARYRPAVRTMAVGGDWFDVVAAEDATWIAVGDVSGHGLLAAAAMGRLRSAWRAVIGESSGPGEVLAQLDAFAAEDTDLFCTTVVVARIVHDTGIITHAAAGHPPLVLIDPSTQATLLEAGRSLPLGVAGETDRPEGVGFLPRGGRLVAYTDGLIERRDVSLDVSLERLRSFTEDALDTDIETVADQLLLLEPDAETDDTAVLVVDRPQEDRPGLCIRLVADPSSLATLRRELDRWGAEVGVPSEDVQQLQILLGEAAANSIRHAYSPQKEPATWRTPLSEDILICVEQAGVDGLACVVHDAGTWDPSPSEEGYGRGFTLMRELAGHLEVHSDGSGTTVFASYHLRPQGRDGELSALATRVMDA